MRKYRIKKEFPDSMAILLGYNIGDVQLTDDQLRIFIDEPPKSLYMEYVLDDFRQAVQQLPYGIGINLIFRHEPNVVILSPAPESEKVENRSMRFLEAVKYAFQAEYSR